MMSNRYDQFYREPNLRTNGVKMINILFFSIMLLDTDDIVHFLTFYETCYSTSLKLLDKTRDKNKKRLKHKDTMTDSPLRKLSLQEQIDKLKSKYVLYKSVNDYHKALNCIQKLIEMGPYKDTFFNQKLNNNFCRCRLKIAIDYWTNGNFEKCVKHMQRIIDRDTTFGAAPYYYIGIYHWFHQQNLKAICYIKKAVTLKPNIQNYRQHLMTITNELNRSNLDCR